MRPALLTDVVEFVVDIAGGRARWWLDDRNDAGRVVLLVDGGAYTYAWPRRNRGGSVDLLPWLSQPSSGEYLARKLRAVEYDREASERYAKEIVCELRRAEHIDREQARELWSDTDYLHDKAAADAWQMDLSRYDSDAWERQVACERCVPAVLRAIAALVAP